MHSAYFIMASQSGTGSSALASTSTDSEGQAHDENTRSVWESTLLTWPSELLECYRFEYNKEGTKAIKATCIVSSNHWGKVSSEYSLLFLHVISVFSR